MLYTYLEKCSKRHILQQDAQFYMYCIQKYYIDTCIISYMSLYFRHKYRVLNNIMIKNDIEEIFYHTSTVIPEM